MLIVACAVAGCAAAAQSNYARFRANNASMAALQPSWVGPVTQPDPRLGQALRLSVANFTAPGAHTIEYGNGHGVSLIIERRFQLDIDSPAFFRNHSASAPDGFGNAGTQVKWRVASGNAEHGNYIVTAMLYHGFAGGAAQNGAFSSIWNPRISAGRAFSRFDVISDLGGSLPTAKIWEQGRAISWNTSGQARLNTHVQLDLENSTAFNRGGPFDGTTQNFLTPAAFYLIRRTSWGPTHAAVILDCGYQVATTHFHPYNHNLITEMRVFF